VNIRPSGFSGWNHQEIFTLKKTLATNAKGKRGAFSFKIDSKLFIARGFSSQCGKQTMDLVP
jgi:hypothetical protein